MDLATMWRIDSTVDDHGRSPVADAMLSHWAHDEGSARFFRSSATFVYRATRNGLPIYLRFVRSTGTAAADALAEVTITDLLRGVGAPVAEPVRSRAGRLLETVDHELGTFHGAVFGEVPGAILEPGDLTDERWHAWGAALGSLHRAFRRLPTGIATSRPRWEEPVAIGAAGPLAAAVAAEARVVLGRLSTEPGIAGDGLIHGDFELDNLVWSDGRIGIVDFGDASRAGPMVDVVLAIGSSLDDPWDAADPRVTRFVQGYRSVCELSDGVEAAIPFVGRMARLRRYLAIRRALTPMDPRETYADWWHTLRERLEVRALAYEASVGG